MVKLSNHLDNINEKAFSDRIEEIILETLGKNKMIDKLIKLANDMDAKGLTAEADRLDAIISKMAEERKMSKEELIMFLFWTRSYRRKR